MKRPEDRRYSGKMDRLNRPIYIWKNDFDEDDIPDRPSREDIYDETSGSCSDNDRHSAYDMIAPYEDAELPEHYKPLMKTSNKIDYAYDFADMAIDEGLTPLVSSVTGSRLRGVDNEDSDIDGLVIVKEKVKSKKLKGDIYYQSLDNYISKLSTSVPYTEFLYSPFIVVDEAYFPMFRAQVVDTYLLEQHAQRFVGHLMTRDTLNQKPEKQLRNSICVWYLSQNLSPLVPRDITTQEGAPQEALDWIAEAKEVEAEQKELARIEHEYSAGKISDKDIEQMIEDGLFEKKKLEHLVLNAQRENPKRFFWR